MRKIFTFFMAMSLSVFGVHAVEATIWEGEYTSAIEINSTTISFFTEGDVLRVYLTIPENGGNFGICYKSADDKWQAHAIPSINNEWPWINTAGEYQYDVTLTAEDITTLAGKNIYIEKGENTTIAKISYLNDESLAPGDEKTLWEGEETIYWRYIAEQNFITAALLGERDQLIVTVSEKKAGTDWPKVNLYNSNNTKVGDDILLNEVSTFPHEAVFTLSADNVTAMKNGFKLCGDGVTVTKLVLKKYDSPTAIDEISQSQGQSQKFFKNGQLFILRDGKTYTLQGQRVQ